MCGSVGAEAYPSSCAQRAPQCSGNGSGWRVRVRVVPPERWYAKQVRDCDLLCSREPTTRDPLYKLCVSQSLWRLTGVASGACSTMYLRIWPGLVEKCLPRPGSTQPPPRAHYFMLKRMGSRTTVPARARGARNQNLTSVVRWGDPYVLRSAISWELNRRWLQHMLPYAELQPC